MKSNTFFTAVGVTVVALVAIEVMEKGIRGLNGLRYKRALKKKEEA